jgi:integrase
MISSFSHQTGTATSSPVHTEASQSINIVNVVNVMLWMKKNAYEDSTIKKTAKILRHLLRNCNTSDPEEVKLYVANRQSSNSRKENLIEAYDKHIKSEGLQWNKPFYQRYDKKRKAPREELVNFLIDHARLEMSAKLAMSKDLGQRPIELTWLTIKDIDLSTGIVSLTGAKHTIGREGKLRPKTIDRLKIFIATKKLKPNSHIYNGSSDNLSTNYRHYRNRVAEEFNMPELKQIQLYDFRRFKASDVYHRTKSVLRVKEILGHSDPTLKTTLKYISLFDEDTSTWQPIVCENEEEIKQAIRDDCILVCQSNGKVFFKKPA